MPVKFPAQEQPPADTAFRRFLTRAETAILIGMVLCVFSLFLPWEQYKMEPRSVPALVTVLPVITRNGFATSTWLPITLCAAFSSLLLMWTPDEKTRLPLALAQGACGLTCVILTLTHAALLPGVLIGLIGGILLTFGAVDRFTHAPQPNPRNSA
jgi:hypothetical protein